MSAAYHFKKIVSIILVLCTLITCLPVNAGSNINISTVATNDSSISDTRQSLASEEIMPIPASEDEDSDLADDSNLVKEEEEAFNLGLTKEHEASFVSLISQLGTEGISLCSAMSDEIVIFPSGTDYRTRVSYEIDGLIYANYESEKTARIWFRLNSPSEQEVSFAYKIYSGSAYPEHFKDAEKGTVSFGAGETEKAVEINIPKLVNNPTVYKTASNPGEFWTGDLIFHTRRILLLMRI